MLKKGNIDSFTYLKEGSNEANAKQRTILTTHVPQPKEALVRGIDVSDMTEDEQDEIKTLWAEYQEYLQRQWEATFKFDDFISHTTNKDIKLKWRSFHPEGIE